MRTIGPRKTTKLIVNKDKKRRPVAGSAAPLQLELEPRSKLHPAEIAGGGFNLAEPLFSKRCVGERETRSVRRIEHLRANLHFHVLADGEFFRQREVEVANAGATQI